MNPAEINPTMEFSLEKANSAFNANPSRNMITAVPFTNGGEPLILNIKGTSDKDSFYVSSFDNRQNFSLPVNLLDRAELDFLFETLAAQVSEYVPTWDVNNPLGKESFWLRLNIDHKTKKFRTVSNLKFTSLKAVEKLAGLKGKGIEANVEVKAWFNLKDEKAGVSINVLSVDFN